MVNQNITSRQNLENFITVLWMDAIADQCYGFCLCIALLSKVQNFQPDKWSQKYKTTWLQIVVIASMIYICTRYDYDSVGSINEPRLSADQNVMQGNQSNLMENFFTHD
ncbi:MAG: hypothetical protein DSM106950_00605 [Stigonema ocellatum SAG 48.90 = DSM 106950]|nr:hypothetical protein [Stigonema ocellatum SAG 48.90 = DSM 106950]